MKIILALTLIATIYFTSTSAAKCVYYGSPGETGENTANGEKFNPNGLTASTPPHIPFGTVLRVTNQRNGRSIEVKVNDRIAGATTEDTIDLTYGAFGMIADHNDGLVPCSYSVL